jgi:hypothetical protein
VTRRKREIPLLEEIRPDQFYRTTLSPAIFGIGWQATRNKVKARELPIPFGDPSGWTGRQILEHRAKMQVLAEQKAVTDAARPKQAQPDGFKNKPRPPVSAPKVKKLKLRTAARGAASA